MENAVNPDKEKNSTKLFSEIVNSSISNLEKYNIKQYKQKITKKIHQPSGKIQNPHNTKQKVIAKQNLPENPKLFQADEQSISAEKQDLDVISSSNSLDTANIKKTRRHKKKKETFYYTPLEFCEPQCSSKIKQEVSESSLLNEEVETETKDDTTELFLESEILKLEVKEKVPETQVVRPKTYLTQKSTSCKKHLSKSKKSKSKSAKKQSKARNMLLSGEELSNSNQEMFDCNLLENPSDKPEEQPSVHLEETPSQSYRLTAENLYNEMCRNYAYADRNIECMKEKLKINYNKDLKSIKKQNIIPSQLIFPQQKFWFHFIYNKCLKKNNTDYGYLPIRCYDIKIDKATKYLDIKKDEQSGLNIKDFLVVTADRICRHGILTSKNEIENLLKKPMNDKIIKDRPCSILGFTSEELKCFLLCVQENIHTNNINNYASFGDYKIMHYNYNITEDPENLYNNPQDHSLFLVQDIVRFPIFGVIKYEFVDITLEQSNNLVWPLLQELFGVPILSNNYYREIHNGYLFKANGSGVYFPYSHLLVFQDTENFFELKILRVYYK
ncbi:hypothetical protein NUSPORA_02194 [Nucleospora cyclopteri]